MQAVWCQYKVERKTQYHNIIVTLNIQWEEEKIKKTHVDSPGDKLDSQAYIYSIRVVVSNVT